MEGELVLYTLVCTYRVVPEERCGGNQVPTNMTSGGVRRKFSQLAGGNKSQCREEYCTEYLPNGMQEKKKMDGRRKSLQADLLGCEWMELRGTLPSTASVPWHLGGLGPKEAKPGCTKPAGAW